MKRLAIIFCSMLITINTLPVIAGNFVFADSIPSGFTQVDNESDQVEAFKYYCKSRNLAIEGSVLDAVTQVTTKAYQTAVDAVSSEIGFDINSLQNELYKRNTSSGQEFFYTASGINAMNRIFAEFLQNNNLSVGDTVDDQSMYNGYFYNNSLVYVIRTSNSQSTYWQLRNNNVTIIQEGSPLIDGDYFYNTRPSTITINGNNYTVNTFDNSGTDYEASISGSNPSNYIGDTVPYGIKGDVCYIFNTTTNNLYLGVINRAYGKEFHGTEDTWKGRIGTSILTNQNSDNKVTVNVYMTTNNNTINNNTYEGDTIIKNNGQTEKPNPPIPDPNDDHNSTTDPINPSDPDSDSNLTFPFLDLDLPSIDWSIGDLSNKFPFSIPFDLYNMFSVLNTEPQTPEIKGNIDLGIYQWSVDWNLHQFDDTAELLRNVEFVGFIIGLIFITRSLIKG